MKHLAMVSALVVSLVGTTALADTVLVTRERRVAPNMLLINPGDLFNGVVSLEYERALTSFFGIVGGFSATTFNGPFNFGRDYYTVVGPELGFRFHFIQDAPAGLWLGPYINGGYVVSRSTGEVSRAWSWGAGAGIGYNFVIGRHFTFQLGAAGGFNDYGSGPLVWAPRLKLGIGGVF